MVKVVYGMVNMTTCMVNMKLCLHQSLHFTISCKSKTKGRGEGEGMS